MWVCHSDVPPCVSFIFGGTWVKVYVLGPDGTGNDVR